MAAIAAGVAVAATAATTAYSATQGAGGGGGGGGIAGPTGLERGTRRRIRDLLGESRGFGEGASLETALLAPYLYQLAGVQAEQDPASLAAANQAESARAASASQLSDAEGALTSAKAYRGKGRKRGIRRAERGLREARRAYQDSESAAGRALQAAGRITGVKGTGRLGTADDQAIEDLLTGRVKSALERGESEDPRLNRELAREESRVREQLRRQFGSDYENTSAGSIALANFRQRRSESLADFARRDVSEYEPMRLGQRKSLADIAGTMQQLALTPSLARFNAAKNLGDIAGNYRQFGEYLGGRQAQQQALQQQQPQQPSTADQIMAGIGKLGSAAGAYAGSGIGATSAASDFVGPTQPRTLRGDLSSLYNYGAGKVDAFSRYVGFGG